MLVHRLRRWPNMKTALVKRVVFAGPAMGERLVLAGDRVGDGEVSIVQIPALLLLLRTSWLAYTHSPVECTGSVYGSAVERDTEGIHQLTCVCGISQADQHARLN